jgi:hypothetical protein
MSYFDIHAKTTGGVDFAGDPSGSAWSAINLFTERRCIVQNTTNAMSTTTVTTQTIPMMAATGNLGVLAPDEVLAATPVGLVADGAELDDPKETDCCCVKQSVDPEDTSISRANINQL